MDLSREVETGWDLTTSDRAWFKTGFRLQVSEIRVDSEAQP